MRRSDVTQFGSGLVVIRRDSVNMHVAVEILLWFGDPGQPKTATNDLTD